MEQHSTGKTAFLCSLALAFGLAPFWARDGFEAHAEGAGAKRIAVVNVSRVFNAYKKVEAIQARLKARFDARRKQLEQKEKELRQLGDEIRLDRDQAKNPETAPVLFAKTQRFRKQEFDLRSEFQKLRMDVEKFRMDQMKQVLKDIRSAIRTIGQTERYDLILRAPEYDEELKPVDGGDAEKQKPRTAMELVRRFRENPVMYFSKGVDVTNKVISRLNAAFAQSNVPAPKK